VLRLAFSSRPIIHVVGFRHVGHRAGTPDRRDLCACGLLSEKFVVQNSHDVICVSREVVRFLQEKRSRAACHLIPNAVAPCFFGVQHQQRSDGEATLLFVGTIYQLKGLLHLIEAQAMVQQELARPVRLRIIGQVRGGKAAADYNSTVRRRAEELGTSRQIEWLGVKNEEGMASAVAQTDLLVLPSLHETFGMCIAEAMAAGVPVVATRVGGIPELVEHGKTGLLVPPGDARELANAICTVLSDPELRRKSATAARIKALAQYTPRRVAEQTLAVYETILRENNS